MSLPPPPKMLSRLRDEEGRAYHDATMQKRRADAMAMVRMREQERLAKLRKAGIDRPSRSGTYVNTNTTTSTATFTGNDFPFGVW